MQRLTLILSDLFLPEEVTAHSPLPRAIDMPQLEGLLRFAATPRRIADWRSWLAEQSQQPALARLPVAQACARGLLDDAVARNAWLAAPVSLEARLDHVRLTQQGLLRLDREERTAWTLEFARVFGPQYALHDVGERGFLLSGVATTHAMTRDPARLLDADIGPALPSGSDAAEIRRLGAEIEMWLHGAALNVRREQARQPRISALWLWGGGISRAHVPAGMESIDEVALEMSFFGADPFIASLARVAGQPIRAESPQGTGSTTFGDIEHATVHAVVEQSPMSGPADQSLGALEARWFGPMRAALSAGALQNCDVIANDRWFRIRGGGGWKFWRPRVHWLKCLATAA